MRIPTGNFGQIVAQPQRQAIAPQDNAIGNAVQRAGQALGDIAGDMQQAEVQKQRARAASVLATTSNDAYDIYDQVSRDVAEGRIGTNDAMPEFQKRLGERTSERTKDLNEDQRMLIDDNLIRVRGTLERGLKDVVLKRTQSETDASLMQTGEQLERAAMRDLPGAISKWNTIVDAVGHWDPVKKQQAKQLFTQTASYNFANAALEGAAQTGDVALVQAARAKIEGEEGEAIDPARRVALITKAYAFENSIKAAGVREQEKAQRELEAREKKAVDEFNDAQEQMLNGRYLSPEYLSRLADTTAGTSVAPLVQQLVKSQAEIAGFASLPLTDQAAMIEQLRAKGSTKGVGTDPQEQKRVDLLQKIHDGSAKAYAENPWQAAQERGVIERAPIIELTDVQTAQQVLADRMQQIGTIEAVVGRKVSPLQPQEAETIGRLVRALPPDQQSAALASFGTMIRDGDRLAAFARQIDAKDKILGTAMMYAGLQTPEGRHVSELLLLGERALRDKTVMVDNYKVSGWRASIATKIRGAFPNQEVEDRMVEAAFYVNAGLALNGDDDVDDAIKLAAGEIVDRSGSKFPLPYGMDEDQFDSRLEAIQPADLAAQAPGGTVRAGKTSIPLEQFIQSLPDAALVHAGQGRYNVRAGMGLVTNEQGQRITIEVRNAR